MIRKLMKLIENYDKIMAVIEDKPVTVEKPKEDKPKSYSIFNTPSDQKEYLEKYLKGVNKNV